MRPGRALLLATVVGLTALTAASAAQVDQSSFLASLNATVTKTWTYSATRVVNACAVKTSGSGRRKISMRTRDNAIIRASRTGTGPVRFSGNVRFLGGVIEQSGKKTTASTGPSACDKTIHRLTCKPITRPFKNQVARPISRRVHRLTFLPMKSVVPNEFFTTCPGEPTAVRSVTGGLELAASKLREADLFDRAVGGIALQGSADLTTRTIDGNARIVQHVAWTLSLRRLGSGL